MYTTKLAAGSGMIQETYTLLDLWKPGMTGQDLRQLALESGTFPTMSARRLRNLVIECFAHRYLAEEGAPANLLQQLIPHWPSREIEQLMFLYTCRANEILADFVRQVYWEAYAAGRDQVSNEDSLAFIVQANQDGKTTSPWADSMIVRVARYLTSTCADFGLLEPGARSSRRILPYRIQPNVAAILAYDLHWSGLGDNAVLAHPDWGLFGMERADVLAQVERLALRGLLIAQSGAGVTKVSWAYDSMEALIDVLIE